MIVSVNNMTGRICMGATAVDALRRYCTDAGLPLCEGPFYDAWGNVIASDSPMCDGRHIFTKSPR